MDVYKKRIIGVFALLLISTGAMAAEDQHFYLNDNTTSTAVDDAIAVQDGVLQGGDNTEDITTTGKIGSALNLDGSADYITVSDNAANSPTNTGITICAWVDADTIADSEGIAHKTNSFTLTHGFTAIGCATGKLCLGLFIGGWKFVNADVGIDTTGGFHHYCGTYDGSNMRVYVDGVQSGSDKAQTGTINDTTNSMEIGRAGTAGRELDGAIDDFRLIKSDIGATAINNIYCNESEAAYDTLSACGGGDRRRWTVIST